MKQKDYTPPLTPIQVGGRADGVCYCLEGNTVDRVSTQNGKGYRENVSVTLNTQDRHAICFQLCGDRDNPSVSSSATAYRLQANPMSDRGQAVCYSVDCRNLCLNEEKSATIQAKNEGGHSLNFISPILRINDG